MQGQGRGDALRLFEEDSDKKSPEPDPLADHPKMDFSKGVRGKHHARMQQGTNVAIIAPDLLDTFPDSEAVNEVLPSLRQIPERTRKRAS